MRIWIFMLMVTASVAVADTATNSFATFQSVQIASMTNECIRSTNKIDIVEWQLQMASQCLDKRQVSAAIDCLIYAIREMRKAKQVQP
jgi:hypothetical protein